MVGLDRRKFLRYLGAGIVAGTATGLTGYEIYTKSVSSSRGVGTSSRSKYIPPGDSTPDYAEFMQWLASVAEPYRGQSLNISMEYEFSPLALQHLDPDFLNASEISDEYELKPYALHVADVLQMVQTKSSNYDIFSIDYQDIASFRDYVWSPTELAEKYPDLTYQSLNSSDYYEIPWSYCTSYPPTPYQSGSNREALFLPSGMSTIIQYYRRDLYRAAGISPAATWDDYVRNAEMFMHSKASFGTVNEASATVSIIFDYLGILASYGGSLWKVKDGQITIDLDSDAAETALETYLSLRPYSDPTSFIYTWDDIATDLLRGIGASALEFQEYSPWMDDPTRCLVVGDTGYSSVPAGPKGSFSVYGGDGIGISIYSKNPEAAWLWLQWANCLGTQEMALLGPYQAFPSRKAVFDNSIVKQALRLNGYEATLVTKHAWDSGNVIALLPFAQSSVALGDVANCLNGAWLENYNASNALSSAVSQVNGLGTMTF